MLVAGSMKQHHTAYRVWLSFVSLCEERGRGKCAWRSGIKRNFSSFIF